MTLSEEQVGRLDEKSAVELPFPCDFLDGVRHSIQNGTRINGVDSDVWPYSPQDDTERW